MSDNTVLRGFVVAEAGEFNSGRGSFDRDGLAAIVKLVNAQPDGVACCYGHHASGGTLDALDAFLGRVKNARLDGNRVLADLFFNPTAFMSTGGVSRGERVLHRARTDPTSFGASLVSTFDKRPSTKRGAPPVWYPTEVAGVDLVYRGDAVHSGLLPRLSKQSPREVLSRETQFAESLSFVWRP